MINPAVGDEITLKEAFKLTKKGKASLDYYVSVWETQGIFVECTIEKNILKSTYKIVHS